MSISFVHRAALVAAVLPLTLAAGCSKENSGAAKTGGAPAAAAVSGTVPPKATPDLEKPIYPPDARARGEQGVVQLNLHVLSDGRVDDAQVLKSSGFPQLDDYAVRGARRWRLTPGTVDGKPATMWHAFKVTYKLD